MRISEFIRTWHRRNESSELRLAREELAIAKNERADQYWWMVEKYIGRQRGIPDYVPEMREYERLVDQVGHFESYVRSLSGRQWDGDLGTAVVKDRLIKRPAEHLSWQEDDDPLYGSDTPHERYAGDGPAWKINATDDYLNMGDEW